MEGRAASTDVEKQLAKQLAQLPDPTDPDFPSNLGDVVSGVTSASADVDPLRVALESLIDDSTNPKTQFAAFYGLLTYVRRLKDLGDFERVFDKYEHHFSDEPLLLLLRSQKYLNDSSSSAMCRQRALDYAELAYEGLRNHYGAIAHLATCIVTVQEYLREPVRKELLRAKALQDRAQSLRATPYPTYKATQARIASLLGDYEGALIAIDEAIEIEPSSATNYEVRIMDHQLVKARIQFRRDFEAIAVSVKEAGRVTENMRGEFLTLLGLLAAVVAFTVTGVNIAKAQPYDTAARLLVTVAGSIVIVFAAFSMLFVRHDRLGKVTIAAAGLALILFSAFAWPHL